MKILIIFWYVALQQGKTVKAAGVLSLHEGRGFLFVTDKIHGGTVNIDNENLGRTSLKFVSANTRVGVSADKEPHFVVNIECVMDIMEIRVEKDVDSLSVIF